MILSLKNLKLYQKVDMGSLTFLPPNNFAVLMAAISFVTLLAKS